MKENFISYQDTKQFFCNIIEENILAKISIVKVVATNNN